jgi:orotate phosphoribosyltransferase
MNKDEIMKRFKESGALLDGHFKLRSGLHSNRFFQAALLLQHPDIAGELCAELAAKFADSDIQVVISPAVGGLIVGHEMARALNTRAIFADKVDGELVLKRGFSIAKGERVLVAEDVVTRGGRVQQTVDLVKEHGGVVAGIAVIVDRSAGNASFDVPHESLMQLELETYEADDCPLCAAGTPIEHPGSK